MPEAENPTTQTGQPRLTERQEAILRLIVHEYVPTGRPVGSRLLTERYPVGVSSATIRNEMAGLEEMGLIEHLHTSGGRVPTAEGYRYFVGNLMGEVELPAGEQIMIRHQFRQAEGQLEGWPDLAATVLAEIAGNVAVVTAPRTAVSRLRHLELISLQPKLALLILVTYESTVRQVMIHLAEDATQEELSRIADALSGDLRGMRADDIRARAVDAQDLAAAIFAQVETTLRGVDTAAQTALRSSGLQNIVRQPEIESAEVEGVLDVISSGELLSAILPNLSPRMDVQVYIGDSHLPEALRRFGLIVGTYGVEDEVTGVLGILGPTRMSYWRSISTVRYMSQLMSDLVADLYPAE